MFCPNCGAPLKEGANFCTNCGEQVSGGAAVLPQDAADADDYLCRAYARCFVEEKDNAHLDKAIADCSTALYLYKEKNNKSATAYRIRAYAFYLKGDNAQALSDCNEIINNIEHANVEDKIFALELQAKINLNVDRYVEAIKDCNDAVCYAGNIFPNTAIAKTYIQACKKLESN